MTSLLSALDDALSRRESLLAQLHTEGTDCYRLFHGTQEGASGLTIDRYGSQLLIQSFHTPLDRDALFALHTRIERHLDQALHLIYNNRSQGNSRIDRTDAVYTPTLEALEPTIGHEWGLNYRIRSRHEGQDPLLFLDLRNARDWIKQNSAGRSVLNLFAYTCGVGLCAAAGGASEVWNLDFAARNLAVGQENNRLNPTLPLMHFVQSDYFPAIRQLAGLPISRRHGQHLPSYPRLQARSFDLVFLDPPAWAKSPFGTVDLLRDYQSLIKPALLATANGGTLVCCNNLAKVDMTEWQETVIRCANKLGRPVRDCQILPPASDFPSFDGRSPLKTLILQL
ncbi:23S rRNA (cytosine1962-C5)-methyltransferase [Pseudomonas duriflava]|uniref:23S rRNA (Cytosine1962-C5)-methyltransferase n=1 Tax=Pseudomonas duriflava TaxID=459528 RepID=A0A562Q2L0_9PSED|nr:class I SAM-dependent methyltransferase [Pseudomonas duriflava]TWI50868.1 23S rRNA (cytosine1962-C5)-methyltransferase [Pseudomonas duriflava]